MTFFVQCYKYNTDKNNSCFNDILPSNLTESLSRAFIFNDKSSLDLVTKKTQNDDAGITYSDDAAIFNNASEINLDAPLDIVNGLTIYTRFKRTSANSHDGIISDAIPANFAQSGAALNLRASGGALFTYGTKQAYTDTDYFNDTNVIHDIVATASPGKPLRIYADGSEVAYVSQHTAIVPTVSPYNARIGEYYDGTFYFHGEIYEQLVFNSELNLDEITSLRKTVYQILKPRFTLIPINGLAGTSVNLTPTQGSITLTGNAPAISIGVVDSATIGNISINGGQPSLSISFSSTATQGSILTTGNTPSLSIGFFESATQGNVSVLGNQPSILSGFSSNPVIGSLNITGYTPSLAVGGAVNLTAGQGSITVTGNQPIANLGKSFQAILGDIVVTGGTPSLSVGNAVNLTANSGSIALSGNTPSLNAGVDLSALQGALSINGYTPSLTVSNSFVETALMGNITIAGGTPSLVTQPIELSQATIDAIVDGVWSKVIETYTADEMMRVFMAALSGKREGLGTATEKYMAVDGVTPRITLTADANGNGTPVINGAP